MWQVFQDKFTALWNSAVAAGKGGDLLHPTVFPKADETTLETQQACVARYRLAQRSALIHAEANRGTVQNYLYQDQ